MFDAAPKYLGWVFLALALTGSWSASAQQTKFPLHIAANQRYLEDGSGHPFLVTGDSAWSLIGDLSREDADKYLADRQSRGFNTILVSLIEHRFSRNAPRNFYQRAPFEANGIFSNPNDAYFNDADWILQRAQDRGFLVFLVPAYLGANGGNEGWYREMQAAGPDVLKSYGRYLGQRYRNFKNIVWVQGGDFDPPDKTLVNALAEGIHEMDPDALQIVHPNRDTDTAEHWKGANWLSFDALYTYGDVAAAVLKRYRDGPAKPFVMIEGIYEGEHGSTEQKVREIAYGALLSGASGQFFGNNPVWHFAGSGLYEQQASWQDSLNSRGARSIAYLGRFFGDIPWWKLEPDQGRLLAAPELPLPGYAVGSLSAARDLAVVYLSRRDGVAINIGALTSSVQQARWFDPSSGKYTTAVRQKTSWPNIVEYTIPHEKNAAGYTDWLLVLTGQD
jgi:hypothetical protein